MRDLILVLAVLLLLGACGAAGDFTETTTNGPTTPTSNVSGSTSTAGSDTTEESTVTTLPPPEGAEPDETLPSTSTSRAPAGDEEPSQVVAARADLASRLDVPVASVTAITFERVAWRDGSLGCPEPGKSYTQAIVSDGYRIVLSVNGTVYEYHGAGSADPVFCADPQPPYEGGSTDL